jgi:hypothetical protein
MMLTTTKEGIEAMGRYSRVTFTSPHGWCCLGQDFIYTVAIMVDVTPTGYKRRYCYSTLLEATSAFEDWAAAEFEGEPKDYIVMKGEAQ